MLTANKTSRKTKSRVSFVKIWSLQPQKVLAIGHARFVNPGFLQNVFDALWKAGFFTKRYTGVLALACLQWILEMHRMRFGRIATFQ